MKLAPHSKLVMIGDSVTDCERARPVGEGLFGAIGKGYVANVDALLNAAYPERAIRVINMGCSGNQVHDLQQRWQSDVIDLKPDWLSIMIGINDVWRQFDLPRQPESHYYLEAYARTLEDLVAQTKPLLQGMVLMTPYIIEPNPEEPMRKQMDCYSAVVRTLAEKYDAGYVDTQAAFDAVLQHCHPMSIAWDRIHPNHLGHMVIARAFLQAVDFAWEQPAVVS